MLSHLSVFCQSASLLAQALAEGEESRHQIAVAGMGDIETLETSQRAREMPNWLSGRWPEWDYPPGAGGSTWGSIEISIIPSLKY